jgi:drug/metabolite transporter superfamily protein YnfA
MRTLRPWIIMSWIMLPGAMLGGSLLLRRLTLGDATPFQATWIRAFHAHGGVLILMSILYYMFLDRTALSASMKHASCATLFVGIGGLVSGFLFHAILGQPNDSSIGTVITLSGAVLMASALVVLIYGLITTPRPPPTIET